MKDFSQQLSQIIEIICPLDNESRSVINNSLQFPNNENQFEITIRKGDKLSSHLESMQNLLGKISQKHPINQIEQLIKKYQNDNILKFTEYIADGGFAVVFKGKNREGNEIAIKLQPNQKKYDNELEQEFKIRENISDFKYIVKPYQYIEDKNINILTMELCKNDLEAEINKKNSQNECFTEEYIVKIVLQLFDGIQEIHSNGIIHQDIKPKNILLNENNEIKFADFGISINLRTTGQIIFGFTKKYCAPEQTEQIEHKNQITNKADIFSLGITLLEMLGASIPNGNGKQTLAEQIQKGKTIELEELRIKEEFRNIFTLIKYEMLNLNPILRKSAIQLKEIYINYFNLKNINLQPEIDRVNKLIKEKEEELKKKEEKDVIYIKDYLRYLHCSLSLLKVDPTQNLKISTDNIENSKIDLSDQIFFFRKYATALIHEEKYDDALKNIEKCQYLINQLQDISCAQNGNNQQGINQQISPNKALLIAGMKEVLADLYNRRGAKDDYEKALIEQKQVINLRKQIYKDNHPDLTQAHFVKAKILDNLNKREEALTKCLKTLDLMKQLYQGDNTNIAYCLNLVCYLYVMTNKYEESLKYGQIALKMINDLKHNNLLKSHSMNNIAACYSYMGEQDLAYEYRQKSLELRIELFGKNNSQVAVAYSTFGHSCYMFKEYIDSMIFIQKSFDIWFQKPQNHLREINNTKKRMSDSINKYVQEYCLSKGISIFIIVRLFHELQKQKRNNEILKNKNGFLSKSLFVILYAFYLHGQQKVNPNLKKLRMSQT